MSRKCPNGFIAQYIVATEGQESPEAFHRWTALGLLSAALRRQCFHNRGMYVLYPNLYICLVAGSARCKKSTALRIGVSRVLEKALPDLPCSGQRLTPELFIKALNDEYKKTGTSTLFVFNDELVTLFGRSHGDIDLVSILTTVYDSPEHWSNRTLSRGTDTIKKGYVTLLSASTPRWLREIIPSDSVAGGFTGRIIFVYAPTSVKRIAIPYISKVAQEAFEDCVHDLYEISQLNGELTFSSDAEKLYVEWYEKVYDPDVGGKLLLGYMNRKADTLIKLAMLLSINERDDLVITKTNVMDALMVLDENERFLPFIMKQIEQTQIGELAEEILEFIRADDGRWTMHSTIVRTFFHKGSAVALADALAILMQANLIEHECIQDSVRYRALKEE